VNGPGVAVTVCFGSQKIAVGRADIDADEHGLRSLKYLVMQTDPDGREIDVVVDGPSPLCGPLMNVVDGAQGDGYAQYVMHEFDDAAKRGPSDLREPEHRLIEPSLGDRQHEDNLVSVIGLRRRESVIERRAGFIDFPIDEWAAHAVISRQGADRC
jgi:hypothetical protein